MTVARWNLLVGLTAGIFLTMLAGVVAGKWLPGEWSGLSFLSGMATMALVVWTGLVCTKEE